MFQNSCLIVKSTVSLFLDLYLAFIEQRAGLRLNRIFVKFLSWYPRWFQFFVVVVVDILVDQILFFFFFSFLVNVLFWEKNQVPQQRNDWECGNFVLYFIKLFMDNAPNNFIKEGYPYFVSFCFVFLFVL